MSDFATTSLAEAAERVRARRVQPALGPADWLWLVTVLALPLWVPVLVGFAVVEVIGGRRR